MKNGVYMIYLAAAILMGFAAYWFLYQHPALLFLFSPYDKSDFESPDEPGSWQKVNPSTIWKLIKATQIYGSPFQVTSGYRSESHNDTIGGVHKSAHLEGHAIDIAHNGDPQAVVDALWEAGFRRIGVYGTHIHADDDPEKKEAVWYS